MNTRLIKALQQVEKLLQQAHNIEPGWESKDKFYQWVETTLRHFRYPSPSRADKGVISRYLRVVTDDSRARASRLIKTYTATGSLKRQQRTTNGFSQKYTQEDKRLLAETDQFHNDLNSCAIKKICERALKRGDDRYERLAGIATSHRYNLRKFKAYRAVRTHKARTQSVKRAGCKTVRWSYGLSIMPKGIHTHSD